MKRACWAAPLGDCEGDLDAAHLISDALWEGKTIGVYDWTMDEPGEIGRKNGTAKIQCHGHNQKISPVDAEGGRLFKDLRRIQQWVLEDGGGTFREPVEYDGWLIERWLLVTTINKMVRHDLAPWHDGSAAHSPPLPLIEAALGRRILPYPMGLWNCEGFDQQLAYGGVGMLRSTAQWGPKREVFGYLYDFAYFRLLCWLSPELPPEPLAQEYRQQYHAFIGPKGRAGIRLNFGDVPGDKIVMTEWVCIPRKDAPPGSQPSLK